MATINRNVFRFTRWQHHTVTPAILLRFIVSCFFVTQRVRQHYVIILIAIPIYVLPFAYLLRQWRWNKFKSGEEACPEQIPEKKFFCVVPLHFFCSTSTISRFGERFRDGQYSFVKFLVCCASTQGDTPCPAICKSGGTCPHAL